MKQLLILSGKGGTGKTTIAGAFIRLLDTKIYADCDVDAPNLHLLMEKTATSIKTHYYGMKKAIINQNQCINCDACRTHCRFGAIEALNGYTVKSYFCEGCGVCEVICPVGAIELTDVVAGDLELYTDNRIFSTAKLRMGNGTTGKLVSKVKKQLELEYHTNHLKNNSKPQEEDIAIIDGSPGIGCPVIASLSGVDWVLIVTEPSLSGICDMMRILKVADVFKTKKMVCINKYDTNSDNTNYIEGYCDLYDIPYVGRIPYDQEAVRITNQGLSIVDVDCKSGEHVRRVFDKVMVHMGS